MLTNTLKKFKAGILMGSLILTPQVFAAASPVYLDDISQKVQDLLAEQEKTQREVAQDMKQYLGLLNLKDLETQNVMRLMLTPLFDSTVTLGTRMLEAEAAAQSFQTNLVLDTADYNMNTLEEDSTDAHFLVPIKEKGAEAMLDPSLGALDSLLASTLLSGYAFETDEQAAKAYEFMHNATNFKPTPAKTPEEIFTDPNAKGSDLVFKGDAEIKYLMGMYKSLPGLTMAQNSLAQIISEKQRFAGFAKDLPIGKDGSASLMEVMAYEVERRYMSEDWYDSMNQMSTEALLREIAFILASQSYMEFKSYERGQRVEAMLAAQMGVLSSIMNPPIPPSTSELTTDAFQ